MGQSMINSDYSQQPKAYMDAIQREFQNLNPEEMPMYLDMKTRDDRTFFQIPMEKNLSVKDLFWLMSQVGNKLERIGWSTDAIIDGFHANDTFFENNIAGRYPLIFQDLEKIKESYNTDTDVGITEKLKWGALGAIIGGILGVYSANLAELGVDFFTNMGLFFDSLEAGNIKESIRDALPEYVWNTALVGSSMVLKKEQKYMNESCRITFSELSKKGLNGI